MTSTFTSCLFQQSSRRIVVVVLVLLHVVPELVAADNTEPHNRRPVTAVLTRGDGPLLIGNRCGSVSVVSRDGASVAEVSIGTDIADLCAIPDDPRVLATDFGGHEILVIEPSFDNIRVLDRISIEKYPVDVAISPKGDRCCVASLWSRRLSLMSFNVAADRPFGTSQTVDLPCAPRRVVFLNNDTVLVTDAFGGRLVVVDVKSATIRSVRELPIHNIRDVALDNDGNAWFTHQILHPKGRTEREHIHWGVLLQNQLTAMPVTALLDDTANLQQVARVTEVGSPGLGAGDPEAIVVTTDRFVVTLAGTSELALIDRVGVREERITTGTRPIAVVVGEEDKQAFVLNSLDDSVAVVDLESLRRVNLISLGTTPDPGPVERGERAFFNAGLSHHRWMSCHSCHTDNHTNNRLADTLGDGSYGNAKRVPSLLGAAWTAPWGWDGSQMLLDNQVRKSLRTTMHIGNLNEQTVTDFVAYLSTLEPPPPLADARNESDETLIAAGRQLFAESGCVRCHQPGQFTTAGSFNVGLTDEVGLSEFNPPSLLGLSQRDRLFHDGRAKSSAAVISEFGHQLEVDLMPEQKRQLLAFLQSL